MNAHADVPEKPATEPALGRTLVSGTTLIAGCTFPYLEWKSLIGGGNMKPQAEGVR